MIFNIVFTDCKKLFILYITILEDVNDDRFHRKMIQHQRIIDHDRGQGKQILVTVVVYQILEIIRDYRSSYQCIRDRNNSNSYVIHHYTAIMINLYIVIENK